MTEENQTDSGIILPEGFGTTEELTKYVNDEEFDPNILKDDGSSWDSLEDYFHNAIKEFATMVAMSVPEAFKGDDSLSTERLSCEAGIEAMTTCISKLEAGLRGEKELHLPGVNPDEHETLVSWYTEAFVDFIYTMSAKLPDKFTYNTQQKTHRKSSQAAIRAFERTRTELIEFHGG